MRQDADSRPRRSSYDWARWSTRRLFTAGLLYGVLMGCVLGLTMAWVDHKGRGDTVELVAFNIVVWCVFAVLGVLCIRWLARHPRRRPTGRDR